MEPTLDEQIAAALAASPTTNPPIEMPPEYVGRGPVLPQVLDTLQRLGIGAPGAVITPAAPQEAPPIEMPPMYMAGAVKPPLISEGNAGLLAPGMENIPPPAPGEPHPVQPPEYAPPPLQMEPERVGNPYTPPKVPRTLAEATAMENTALANAGRAQETAGQAELAAKGAGVERQAGVYERSAQEQAALLAQHQRERQAAEAKADSETADWVQRITDASNQEPNPNRWWNNQSDFSQAMWALSVAFGAMYSAANPRAANDALDAMRAAIDRDVQSQRERIGRNIESLKIGGTVMRERQARTLSDLSDDNSGRLSRLQSLERAWAVRASAPGTEDRAAIQARAQAVFSDEKLKVIGGYRAEKVQAYHQQLQFGHAAAMQSSAQKFQAAENEKNRQLQRDLAQEKIAAKLAQKLSGVDEHGLPVLRQVVSGPGSQTGAVLTKGGKMANGGVWHVRTDEQLKEANEITEGANLRYAKVKELSDRLDNMTDADKYAVVALGQTDPIVESLTRELSFVIAKSSVGGRISNQEIQNSVRVLMGFDPDGNWKDRAKFVANLDTIREKLHEDLRTMPGYVSQSLSKLNDPSVSGGDKVVWEPQAPNPAPPVARNALELSGQLSPAVAGAVESGADYLRRSQIEGEQPGRRGYELPPHDAAAVHRILDTAPNRGPGTIADEAAKVLAELGAKERELIQTARTQQDPWHVPEPGEKPVDPAALAAEVRKLQNTSEIVTRVAQAAEVRAADTLRQFESVILANRSSDDDAREIARKEFLLTDATKDVEAIIKRTRKERRPFGE